MLPTKIDGKRLKTLMDDKNIKAYKLAQELNQMGYSITTNTISNYMKELTPPKSLENVQALAEYFNVSVEYLLGIAPTSTNNLEIKNFCNKYGLNEKSLIALEKQNQLKKDFKFPIIDTINYLLEDLLVNKQNSILNVLTDYLFFYSIQNGIKIPIKRNRDISMIEKLTVDSDTAVKSILIKEIETKLDWMKSQIKEEVNKNECKRKNKKQKI